MKGNLLFYKEKPSDRDVIGVIVLEGCTVQLCESDEQFAFSLVWSEPGLRTYKFSAEDQRSLESWIKALLTANHNYLALLLKDMERKYRETRGMLSMDKANTFIMPKFPTSEASLRPHPSSAQPSVSASVPGAGPGVVPGPILQPTAAISAKSTPKRSPKIKPKKTTNAANVHTPAMFYDWTGVPSDSLDEFIKMHEEFGKEVKELIYRWAKKSPDGEENLIDFS